jgi:hypothetical protein
MKSLYLLFAAGYMLRNVKVEGLTKSHDYPKMMLTEMLMLEYWRTSDHVIWEMMDGNMSMFNEEYGEIFFGILSRCVLGDHIKSSFEHMNEIYTLLPVYRSIKEEIMKDHDNSKHSLNWHHKIPVDSEEVHASAFFFKQMIRQICANNYDSYAVTTSYKRPAVLDGLCRYNAPIVYNPNVGDELEAVFGTIRNNLEGFFLHKHQQTWPEAKEAYDVGGDERGNEVPQQMDEVKIPEVARVYGSPWAQCIVGRFAVTRDVSDVQGTSGICVYKIVRVLPTVTENGLVMNTFVGREYICNLSNHNVKCVKKGAWNHYPQLSKESVVNNWYVISYFALLGRKKQLPVSAVDDIELDGERDAIFGEGDA